MFTSIFFTAIAALPLVASQSLPSSCDRTYNVVQGDTCNSISAANNASTYQLAAVNSPNINPFCSNLAIGETICLGTKGQDCQATYVVVPNDTCNGINAVFGINATILYANNPQINSECTNIYVGEVLCVLDQVRVPPAPPSLPLSTAAFINPGTATANPAPESTPADDDLPWCD